MNRIRQKPRTLLVTAILAVAALGYVVFVFLPGQKAVGQMRRELIGEQQFIVQADRLAFAIQQTERELAAARQLGEKWRAASPGHDKLVQLFGRFTELAQQAGVGITRLEPDAVVEQSSIWHTSVAIHCHGDFRQIFQFIRSLERQEATIWLTDMNLELAQGPTAAAPVRPVEPHLHNAHSTKIGERLRAEITLMIFADKHKNSD